MRRDFALSLDSLGPLFVSLTVGYLASSFFAGRLMARLRLGVLLALSTLFAGAALVGYAIAPGWWIVVVWASRPGWEAGASTPPSTSTSRPITASG